MTSELIALQAQLLKLQDEERDIEERERALRAELFSYPDLQKEVEAQARLHKATVEYISLSLASAIKSKRLLALHTPVVGEIRIQLSKTESVVIEVGTQTEFGDLVEYVLDYILYPKTSPPQNSQNEASSLDDDSSTKATQTRMHRPRSDFFLQDSFGAIFCNEDKVVETFSTSSVLWMAHLAVRPESSIGNGFDAEQEISNYFGSLETAKWMVNIEEKEKEDVLVMPEIRGISDMDNGVLVAFDYITAKSKAQALLFDLHRESLSKTASDLTPFTKPKRNRIIDLANDKRNQSRRRGLLLECVLHLMFILFVFFTCFVYAGISTLAPDYVSKVYAQDFSWDTSIYPTLEQYFQHRVSGWKRRKYNMSWITGEVRIRQLRTQCGGELDQCDRYNFQTDTDGNIPFSPAVNTSTDPSSFFFQFANDSIPVIELSPYWDNTELLATYDGIGGYFKYWPRPNEDDAVLPDFNGWIDAETAFISIEFNAYEPSTGIIVAVKVIAQYPSYRTGSLPSDTDVTEVCGTTPFSYILPIVLVRANPDVTTLNTRTRNMTILCGFALVAGCFSIFRVFDFCRSSISGDQDIARAVEVLKPNAGLLRSAMMALRVSNSNRSFNPNKLSQIFWALLDLITVSLLIAALVYQYAVLSPQEKKIEEGLDDGLPLLGDVSSLSSGNYTEIYGVMRDRDLVLKLLAYASWIALFSAIRELRMISSGVLIADTVTHSIFPGFIVLFFCGYAPLGITFANIGSMMFGYMSEAFSTIEMAAYTIVSRHFSFDFVVAPFWQPFYTLLLLLYYTVTSAIAYAVVFDAFRCESSKLVKGPFTIWEILWPLPAIRSWMRQGFNKSDLWSSNVTYARGTGSASNSPSSRFHNTTVNNEVSTRNGVTLCQDGENAQVGRWPHVGSSDIPDRDLGSNGGTRAESLDEDNESPEVGNEVCIGSFASSV